MLQMKNPIQLFNYEINIFVIIKQACYSNVLSSFFNMNIMKKERERIFRLLHKFNLIPVFHRLPFLIKLQGTLWLRFTVEPPLVLNRSAATHLPSLLPPPYSSLPGLSTATLGLGPFHILYKTQDTK